MNISENIDLSVLMSEISHLGMSNPHEMLFYLPINYFDFTKMVRSVRDGLDTQEAIFFRARITKPTKINMPQRGKPASATVYATDGYENFTIGIFGNIWGWKDMQVGQDFYALGKASLWQDRVTIKSAKLVPSSKANGIVPQYRAKKIKGDKKEYELSSDKVHFYITQLYKSSVGKAVLDLCNYVGLPESEILERLSGDLSSLAELFLLAHFPKKNEDILLVNKVIVTLHALKVIVDASQSRNLFGTEDSVINLPVDMVGELIKQAPFELSIEQKRSIWDIMKRLASNMPTDHLLSGDVGCGKTIVYAVIAVASQLVGKNVVIMIPNLPLASQVKGEIETTFPQSNVLFIEKGSKAAFDPAKSNPILIGTSALIHWLKKNPSYKPDLFIVDEQQKTGTSQKDIFLHDSLNVIEATATALPRTLMLSTLGIKSISKIEEPPVRKNIKSKVVYVDEKKAAFKKVKDVVSKGDQVCVLYPLRDKSNELVIKINSLSVSWNTLSRFHSHDLFKRFEVIKESGLESVTLAKMKKGAGDVQSLPIDKVYVKRDEQLIDALKNLLSLNGVDAVVKDRTSDVQTAFEQWSKLFPDNVVMIHGGLTSEQKIEAIRQAKSGEKKIIVSSSIIEVGITIPDLRLLIVINPEQLGISTLHQIRGRLARHGGDGLFMMLLNKTKDEVDEDAIKRLRSIERYKKGSQLAEQDMLQRGFGDLSSVGIDQAGHLKSIFFGLKLLPEDVFSYIKSFTQKPRSN